MANVGEVIIDFFRFYGLEFDYLANYVTIAGDFPEIYAKIACPQPTVCFDGTGMHTVIVIQDPINPENNLASSCRETRNIIQLFSKSHAALTSGDGTRSGPSMLSLILSAEEWLWERMKLQEIESCLSMPSTISTKEPPQLSPMTELNDAKMPAPQGRKRSQPRVLPTEPTGQLLNGGAAPVSSPSIPSPVVTGSNPGTCVHQRECAQPFHVKQLLHHLRPPFDGRPAA